MQLLSALYAAIEMIGLLDKWAERSLTSYRKFKEEQNKIAVDKAIVEAHKNGDVEEVQRLIDGEKK